MNEKVTQLAISSRVILLFLQFVSNLLIPDHNPSDVFKSPFVALKDSSILHTTTTESSSSSSITSSNITSSTAFTEQPLDKIAKFLFGGLLRWDAEYFLYVSENGYTYENTLAFYPLFPIIIRALSKILLSITFYLSYRYIALICATLLNIYFFYRAANCLYDLTQKVFGDLNKSWNAVILFCFNPASIFFSAPYSESLYCWLTFSLMLECVTHLRLIKTTITLCLSILCRSNGILNIGFPIYFILRKIIIKKSYTKIFNLIVIICISLIPLTFYNFYVFQLFCRENSDIKHSQPIIEYAKMKGFVLSGSRNPKNSPWCDKILPVPYSYVQNYYWNVGFLNYYQLKQIPNFLIATPILILIFTMSFQYFKKLFNKILYVNSNENDKQLLIKINDIINDWQSLPFVLHCCFLAIFCTLFIHIQVTTRLIASASPLLYWYGAELLPKTFIKINFSLHNMITSRSSLIVYWFGSYFVIGTILFSNFYPWT